MDKILEEIEQEFLPAITKAQDVLQTANQDLSDLVAQKAEKMESVRRYYEAIAQKEQAELIITNTPDDIKKK